MSVRQEKRALRSAVGALVGALEKGYVERASEQCCARVQTLAQWRSGSGVSVYLSMGRELQTRPLLERAFAEDKRVCVPLVVGGGAADMRMPAVGALAEVDAFPRNSWGIPEPSAEAPELPLTSIELVLVPGVAFDASCHRLGHGKGEPF